MFFNPFKKQKSDPAHKRRMVRAPNLTLVQSEAGDKTLAMGMSWQAVVTDGRDDVLQKRAQAISRKAGATHFVLPQSLFALGVGKVVASSGGSIYSAALIASQHADEGLFVLGLPGERVWVCLIQQGKPQGTELVALTVDAALGHIEELLEDAPDLRLFSDLHIPGNVEALSFSDLMNQGVSADFLLHSASTKSAWSKIPLPFKVVFVLLVGVLFVEPIYKDMIEADKAEARRKMLAAEVEAGKEQWRNMSRQEYSKRARDLDILVLRRSFNPVPVAYQGWVLQRAQCDSEFNGGTKKWQCFALYNAPEKGVPFATNKDLVIPPGFGIDFSPPRSVRLSWTVEHSAKPLNQEELLSPEFHLLRTASLVQEQLPKILDVTEIKFLPIAAQIPRGSDGSSVSAPDGIILPKEAQISVQANINVFDPLWAIPADWKSAKLSVKQGVKPELILDMQGVLYAK